MYSKAVSNGVLLCMTESFILLQACLPTPVMELLLDQSEEKVCTYGKSDQRLTRS